MADTFPSAAAVRLCRRAFAAIEHTSSMESFEEGSTDAERAGLHYDPCRQQVLEGVDWNFASEFAVLAEQVDGPSPEGKIRLHLPADCIRVREVTGMERGGWSVHRRQILSQGVAPLLIRYTADATNPALFPASFQTALVHCLAAALSPVLTTSINRTREQYALFEAAIERARAEEAIEAGPSYYTDTEPLDLSLYARGRAWAE